MWLLYGFLGVVLFGIIWFLSMNLVVVGICRLFEIDLIIFVLLLCSKFVNVYLFRVLGIGVIVFRIVVGFVFNVIDIG